MDKKKFEISQIWVEYLPGGNPPLSRSGCPKINQKEKKKNPRT